MQLPAAIRSDYNKLSPEMRVKYAEVLKLFHKLSLSCRCEVVGGRDFIIVTTGPGLPPAKFWMDRFDISY
jgi:hypothetical protein